MNAYLVYYFDSVYYVGSIRLSKNLKKAISAFKEELSFKVEMKGNILCRNINCDESLPLLWKKAREEYPELFLNETGWYDNEILMEAGYR